MQYLEFKPSSQANQLENYDEFLNKHPFDQLSPLTLVCAGMGSGKTKMIIKTISKKNGINFVIAPNSEIKDQLLAIFSKEDAIDAIDACKDDYLQQIKRSLKKRTAVAVVFSVMKSKSGKLSKSANKFIQLLTTYKDSNNLIIIDEIDNILTSMTGGINAKVDHPDTNLKHYEKICKQNDESLNIFDLIREYGAKTITFSGTNNNFVASKIPSTGYNIKDISILNYFPIESLYTELKIEDKNLKNIKSYKEYLEHAERKVGKILLVFPDEGGIENFKKQYRENFKKNFEKVSVTISSENLKERKTFDWKHKLNNAKYVIGINLLNIGFDLNSICTGQQFILGIIFREFSDAVSQPLSKNDTHSLYLDMSAGLLQVIARLRKGGTVLVKKDCPKTPLYESLQQIFHIIKNGRGEADWVGEVGTTQKERYHQCILLALIQNLKIETSDRKNVENILQDLNAISHFEAYD
jgi:hypothetical protein